MKVKCIKIYNNQNEEQSSSPWLTIGKIYIPLEILCDIKNGISYRLVGDAKDKSPGVFKAVQFEIISTKRPSNWVINIGESGFVDIGPQLWQKPGFWESCYEGDLPSLEIYKQDAKIIYEEEI